MSGAAAEEFLLEADLDEGFTGPAKRSAIECEAFGPYPSKVFQGRRKRPPFAKLLSFNHHQTLYVLTGSGGWTKGKSRTWGYRRKVVLPMDVDPRSLDWSVAEEFEDCLIVNEENAFMEETIRILASELLVHTEIVLYIEEGTITRFMGQGGAE